MTVLEIQPRGIDHRQQYPVIFAFADFHTRRRDLFSPFGRPFQERVHVCLLIGRRSWGNVGRVK